MRALTFIVVFALACSPPSVVVHFDTDAPVRSTAGDPIMSPTPLFDALRVEVYPPNATTPCAGCVNDFDVTAEMFARGTVSLGVPLTNQSGYVLHARLYLRRLATSDGPAPDASIDKIVSIPTSDSGMTDGLVFFDTDSAGASHDPTTDTPDALAAFDGASSSVGTWPSAQRALCDETATPPPKGSVCIPGGAYWMGTQDGQPLPNRSATWHRLAVMSPFYLDADEASVARLRAANLLPGITFRQTGVPAALWCTFTTSPGPYESFPVNCLDAADATPLCTSAGGALPTGAQFEYVATQLGRSPYPWGFDEPTCAGVVWSRESTEFSNGLVPNGLCFDPSGGAFTDPSTSAHIGGPEAPTICTSSPCTFLDRVVLDASASPSVEVRNLAGNIGELTADQPFSETSTDCWGDQAGVILDPTCPMKAGGHVEVRASDWAADQVIAVRAENILDLPPSTSGPNWGFRCAYPATPLGN
jgi:hypothetical protein